MVLYQNLAYCRYLFLWSFLFLLNIIPYSPMISITVVIIIDYLTNEKKDLTMTQSKMYGMFLSEIILIYLCLNKKFNIDLLPNFIFFVIYFVIVKFMLQIDPIKLHKEYLLNDDVKFKKESYIEYMCRIWTYFIFPFKKHAGASGIN